MSPAFRRSSTTARCAPSCRISACTTWTRPARRRERRRCPTSEFTTLLFPGKWAESRRRLTRFRWSAFGTRELTIIIIKEFRFGAISLDLPEYAYIAWIRVGTGQFFGRKLYTHLTFRPVWSSCRRSDKTCENRFEFDAKSTRRDRSSRFFSFYFITFFKRYYRVKV